MIFVLWSPKSGGPRGRQFRSLRRAKSFLPEACRQDFSASAYLAEQKNGRPRVLQQWHQGAPRWSYTKINAGGQP